MSDLPLDGVRVVDFTANMSGPLATMILGDQGADVVKVEPPAGDALRVVGTNHGGMSAYFANLNRSKRSVALDITSLSAGPVVDRLLDWADVSVMNYRPGVAHKLGLDAERVRSGRDALIYVDIVGFGSTGPYGDRPAYDHVIQALSGFAATQADRRTATPSLVKHGIIDKSTGMATAQAITAALVQRGRNGVGRTVHVSMLDVAIATLWPDGMMNHTITEPDVALPAVTNTFRVTETRDGHVVFILLTAPQWSRLLTAFDLGDEGQLDTPESRMQNGGAFMRRVASRLSQMGTDEAVDLLASAGIPVAPVVSLDEVASHPQVQANQTVDDFHHPVLGHVRQANPAVRFGVERAGSMRPAPRLGEHSAEVLAEHGFDDAAVASMVRDGVLYVPE